MVSFLALYLVPVFTTSRFGKPVIEIGQYRFNKYHRSKGPKGLWVCVKQTAGCRATITTIDDVIIKYVKFLATRKGKEVALVDGFTFSINWNRKFTQRWKCVNKQAMGCPAYFTYNLTAGKICRINKFHTHPPQAYEIFEGKYIGKYHK
ncbi:FLYWCH zinc finger domain-containing protein [Phthorimaea operculella]|nr:FLYWCH zinc finger domain-containing protein [Phthorimaea operculella]